MRTPSIEEEFIGAGTLDAESVIAAEAGWRGQVTDGVNLDVALYYNDYKDVRIYLFDDVTFEESFSNDGRGHAHGAEVAVDVKATDRWTLRGAYSIHRSKHQPKGLDFDLDFVDSQYPVHLLNLRSYVDIAKDWELDTALYLVERFDDPSGLDGPEYWRGDVRLGWQAMDGLRMSLGVQGFNDPTRSEFGFAEARRLFYFSVDITR